MYDYECEPLGFCCSECSIKIESLWSSKNPVSNNEFWLSELLKSHRENCFWWKLAVEFCIPQSDFNQLSHWKWLSGIFPVTASHLLSVVIWWQNNLFNSFHFMSNMAFVVYNSFIIFKVKTNQKRAIGINWKQMSRYYQTLSKCVEKHQWPLRTSMAICEVRLNEFFCASIFACLVFERERNGLSVISELMSSSKDQSIKDDI